MQIRRVDLQMWTTQLLIHKCARLQLMRHSTAHRKMGRWIWRSTLQFPSNYWYLPSTEQAAVDEARPSIVIWHLGTIRKFAHGNPDRPLILLGVTHDMYIDNETQVVRESWKFLGISFEQRTIPVLSLVK